MGGGHDADRDGGDGAESRGVGTGLPAVRTGSRKTAHSTVVARPATGPESALWQKVRGDTVKTASGWTSRIRVAATKSETGRGIRWNRIGSGSHAVTLARHVPEYVANPRGRVAQGGGQRPFARAALPSRE